MKSPLQAIALLLAALSTGPLRGGPGDAAPHREQLKQVYWKYSGRDPGEGWAQPSYDDSSWLEGLGGFGVDGTPQARIGTVWAAPDIWLRRHFLLQEIPDRPALLIHHNDGAEVFLNGKLVSTLQDWTINYEVVPLDAKAREALVVGKNLIAVHCRNSTPGQFIDAYLVDANRIPRPPPERRRVSPLKPSRLTAWGEKVTRDNAWPDYPRPQLIRENWTNLNGLWEFAVLPLDAPRPTRWDGHILVPYCLESQLSGVGRLLHPDEALWYRRTIPLSRTPGHRTILNFEAVDYRCEIWLNRLQVGSHTGGYVPFSVDLTEAIQEGENELVIRVQDPTGETQLTGKQSLKPATHYHTRVSGIWQTVWLETVPERRFDRLKIQANHETGIITITPELTGPTATAERLRLIVRDSTQVVAERNEPVGVLETKIENPKLWSPTSPHLYDLELSLLGPEDTVIDKVESYAGIRTVGRRRDEHGHWRFTLNGEVLFPWGTIDQGWWPGGILTPPSDEAMVSDILFLKNAGFNMIRKHAKLESRRYYHHCDRLGMMVWQDHVSPWSSPEGSISLNDTPKDQEWNEAEHGQFMTELKGMVDAHHSSPSIVVWTIFNHGKGQHRSLETGKWLTRYDPSRLISISAGGFFWPVGHIADTHASPLPDFPFARRFEDYLKVVGLTGDIGMVVPDHFWNPVKSPNRGMASTNNLTQFKESYQQVVRRMRGLKERGVAAGAFIQTSDVEVHVSGLLTFDRRKAKIPAADLREMNRALLPSNPQ